MSNKLSIIAISFFLSSALWSQNFKDTLLMRNGNIFVTSVIEYNDSLTRVVDPKRPNKNIIIENDRIFSVTNENGERLVYKYDSIKGDDFTIDEMRYFILGEQDAQRGFKARGAMIGGIIVGVASGITGSFLAPIPPFAYSMLVGIPKVKVNRKYCSNPELIQRDAYLMGYEEIGSKKRKIHSLISGFSGLVVGLVTWKSLKDNGIEILK